MIMADMTVPSRTPAKYPKNIMDNAAAVITNETSQYGFTFPNSFFNTLAIATMNPSPERYTISVLISSNTPKAITTQLINSIVSWEM